jgi:hypothetical protein
MGYGRTTGHEDNESSFATDEVDQQLEEGVNGEGLEDMLVLVTCTRNRSDLLHTRPEMGLSRRQPLLIQDSPMKKPSISGPLRYVSNNIVVDWTYAHQQYSHNISLKKGFPVVLAANNSVLHLKLH